MANLKLRALVQWPATVSAGTAIAIAKANGIWTVSINVANLPVIATVPNADQAATSILSYNSNTAAHRQIAFSAFVAQVAAAQGTLVTPQCRATLTSGVAVTTSDVTAATTIYCTPASGDLVPIYDGSVFVLTAISEMSLALDSSSGHTGYHQSGKNFDVFVFNDGAVRYGSGPAWSSDTARGTGAGTTELEMFNGLWVNKNSIVLRYGSASGSTSTIAARRATYVNTFRTTADGQTEDSFAKRFVWNAWNQQPRDMKVTDATVSWTYSTATVRQANANTANKIDFVTGLAGAAIEAELQTAVQNSTTTGRTVDFGIALDSITTLGVDSITSCSSVFFGTGGQKYRGFPGLGRHYLAWLEKGAGTDTQTWFGVPYSQLVGRVWG